MKKKLGILLSGRGSNFLAIYQALSNEDFPAEIGCIISNKKTAPGLIKAIELGLPSYYVKTIGEKRDYEQQMIDLLEVHKTDLVCLAGFMKILGPDFVGRFRGRILNIHPALLPSFPGLHAQRRALEYGVKYSGCTVHFVDEGVDTGPIVDQIVVPILNDDTQETLSARILEQEHQLYIRAIKYVLGNQYIIKERRVLKKK